MTLDNKLKLVSEIDIEIDVDILKMTSERCCKNGEMKTPSLLRLEDTKENYNRVKRYIFWNVIWKSLHKLGWNLVKDGNSKSNFIVVSPLDPVCTVGKKNEDFFDDEVMLMMTITNDPRLNGIAELRMLGEVFDLYLFHFSVLKDHFANLKCTVPDNVRGEMLESNSILLRSLNSLVLRYLNSLLKVDQQKYQTEERKKIVQQMFICEYERSRRMNGGKIRSSQEKRKRNKRVVSPERE